MEKVTLADRVRALADALSEGCEPNFHRRFISVEEDTVGMKPFTTPWGCYCSIGDKANAIATELERVAGVLREERLDEPGTPMWIRAWAHDIADALAGRGK